ncbi:MAG: YDG domain-containing protein [Sulfuritalea sp.]|jgi:filamentous hemagglutinin family protein|nr:YDG domain-containing protein [Sulfuritalea sp.]
MNRSYRSIWNDKTGTHVAASENATSTGKKSSTGATGVTGNARFALKGLAVFVMMAFGANVFALPVGGVVAEGGASISSTAGSTTITQSSQNVAINWQSFSIGVGEAVQFVQPNSNSVALNRVLGPDPSSILGSMSANGKVFLINPNGILFGKGAQINVGGLVASTLNVTDNDFMAGRYQFSGNSDAVVLNQGTINADGGYVALLGANVGNEGIIVARLGSVALAAGNAITLDVAGDGLLNVTVNQGAVNALVQNGGLIQADGGQVLLTALAAGTLLQSAVNNTGVIQAQTIENRNGTIRLMGDMQIGTVNVGGRLDASAPNGGDGGFIETSAAHVKIDDGAIVSTQSAQGKPGTWLIDPFDFTIATAGGDITPAALAVALAGNVTISSNLGGAGVNGDINVNNDVTWGAATTLTLNAVRNVNLNANITATTGNLVATAGTDVIVNAMPGTGITMTTTGGNMTWTAGNDIWVKAGVVGGITATGAGPDRANITWTAGRDIKIDSTVTTTDANFTACCGRDISITAAMTTTRGHVVLKAGNDGSGLGVAGVGGTVVFAPGILYTVTGATPAISDITIDSTPASYAVPNDYSAHFTGTASTFLTQHMLVFAKGNDKVYDGNTTATLSFLGNPALGGDVTLVSGVATFDDKNVAANIGITYAGYSLGGADVAKFALWTACVGPTRTSAAITPLDTNISGTRVYDATPTAAGTDLTTISALIAGDTVTVGGSGAVANKNVGVSKAVTSMGTLALGGADAGNYNLVNGALTITPINADISGTRVYDATTTAPSTVLTTINGLLGGDTVTVSGSGDVATKDIGVLKNVTNMGSLALAGTDAGNYNLVSGAMTITPLGITGSITAADKVFDATTTATITSRTLAGVVGADTVTYTGGTATFDTAAVGAGKTVTGSGLGLSGADAGNYTVNPNPTTTAAITPVAPPEEMMGERMALTTTPAWWPTVVSTRTPDQLLAFAPPATPPVLLAAEPIIAPAETPPKIYVAPHFRHKQDRN